MAFIKRSKGEINYVFVKGESKLDDEETREAMKKAADAKKEQIKQSSESEK